MPAWTLTATDGKARSYEVTRYVIDEHVIVLAFAAKFSDGFETYTFAPEPRHAEVVGMLVKAKEAVAARSEEAVRRDLQSARGVVCQSPLTANYIVDHLADQVAIDLFSNEALEFERGDFYNNRTGVLVFRGRITVNQKPVSKKKFLRIADGSVDTLEIIGSAVNPSNNSIVAFQLKDLSYYNLRKHQAKHDFLEEARVAAKKARSLAKAIGKEVKAAWGSIRPYVAVGGTVLDAYT